MGICRRIAARYSRQDPTARVNKEAKIMRALLFLIFIYRPAGTLKDRKISGNIERRCSP